MAVAYKLPLCSSFTLVLLCVLVNPLHTWSFIVHDQTNNSNEGYVGDQASVSIEQPFEVDNIHGADVAAKGSSVCVGCSRRPRSRRIDIDEMEVNSLRIEYIKQTILRKLRLKKPPQGLIPLSELPKPLGGGVALTLNTDESKPHHDDFYGKTTQAVLFPFDIHPGCDWYARTPATCASLSLPDDMDFHNIRSAELWFYKMRDMLDKHNQTFVVSQIAHWDTQHSFPRIKPMMIFETDVQEGWIKVEIAPVVREWLRYGEHNHSISIACKTCAMEISESPVSLMQEHKMFLVITTYDHASSQTYDERRKRHLDCTPQTKDCCRQKLFISFAEIGWDDWIIFPPGYHAYFCRGSCNTVASVTLSASHHNSVIRRLLYQGASDSIKLELLPCCAATQYQPLQLLYMDNNNTITKKSLPNMIVESCGCM